MHKCHYVDIYRVNRCFTQSIRLMVHMVRRCSCSYLPVFNNYICLTIVHYFPKVQYCCSHNVFNLTDQSPVRCQGFYLKCIPNELNEHQYFSSGEVTGMSMRASLFFTLGLRSFYAFIPLLMWILGATWLLVITILEVLPLFWFGVRSFLGVFAVWAAAPVLCPTTNTPCSMHAAPAVLASKCF